MSILPLSPPFVLENFAGLIVFTGPALPTWLGSVGNFVLAFGASILSSTRGYPPVFGLVASSLPCLDPNPSTSFAAHRIFNVGNSAPTQVLDFIKILEKSLNKKAKLEFYPRQPGDVLKTGPDISLIEEWIDYNPSTSLEKGVDIFVKWFCTIDISCKGAIYKSNIIGGIVRVCGSCPKIVSPSTQGC